MTRNSWSSRPVLFVLALVACGVVYFATTKDGERDVADLPDIGTHPAAGTQLMENTRSTLTGAQSTKKAPQENDGAWTTEEEREQTPKQQGVLKREVEAPIYNTQMNDLCPGGHKVLTVATAQTESLCRSLYTALWHGVRPQVVGYGGPYRMNVDKAFYMLEELSRLPPDCIVTFTDADIMYQGGADGILEKYRSLGSPKTLVSTECKCMPWALPKFNQSETCMKFMDSPTAYRFLNSGMIMGRAADLIPVYRRIFEYPLQDLLMPKSDQERMTRMYLYEPEFGIALDHYANISMSMSEPNMTAPDAQYCPTFAAISLDEKSQKWENSYTNNFPSLLHFNGRAHRQMDDFWSHHATQVRRLMGEEAVMKKTEAILDTKIETSYSTRYYGEMCQNWVRKYIQGKPKTKPDYVPVYAREIKRTVRERGMLDLMEKELGRELYERKPGQNV